MPSVYSLPLGTTFIWDATDPTDLDIYVVGDGHIELIHSDLSPEAVGNVYTGAYNLRTRYQVVEQCTCPRHGGGLAFHAARQENPSG